MRTIRYWIRLTKAFLGKFRAIMLLGILAGFGLFLTLSAILPKTIGRKTEYIGMTGRYHVEELPQEILHKIGDGLTAIDESGAAVPALADSWESTDDGKTWRFTLGNHTWQDGTPVTAKTIFYSFEDVETRVIDEKTIEFVLADAFSPFPTILSRPTFKKGLLGTGEWKVTHIDLAGEYVQKVILTNAAKDRLIYRFYPTEDRTKLAFKRGEVDAIVDMLEPTPFNEWKNQTLIEESVNDSRFAAVFFNEDSELFRDNKTLRQALSYAINKEALGFPRAISPLNPHSWAYNSQVKDYAYNPDRAKELLGENKERVELTLSTTPLLLPIAERVRADWEAINVFATIQVVSYVPTDYQAYLVMYDIPKDPDQYALWHSTQEVTNIARYKSPRVDKLLEDGRVEMDIQTRKKIYLDFQRFLLEDAPAAFLYHPKTYTIRRS